MTTLQNKLSANCTSDALRAISSIQEDEDGCVHTFYYALNNGFTAVTFKWEFGDGSISFAPNPTYKYSEGIQFTVTLTITDQNGCTSSKTLIVYPGDCPGGFCNYIEGGNDCCIDICVDEVEGWTWEITFPGTGDEISYLPGEDVTTHYCFEENGIYTIKLKYYDGTTEVAEYSTIVEVNSCSPDPENCDYWLCFVDYYDQNSCYESITYEINNVPYTYIFNETFGGNAWGPTQSIIELSLFANSLGLQYSNSYDELEDCLKGAGQSFGHFFINSPYEIISLNYTTDTDCATPQCCGVGCSGTCPSNSSLVRVGCCTAWNDNSGFYRSADVIFKNNCD